MQSTRPPWWRGTRGEWYVAIQIVLFALILLGPRTLPGLPAWSAAASGIARGGGVLLMVSGALLLLASAFRLGSNLTPLPYPKAHATLVQSGPYRVVRHPIYAGVILLAYGWAFFVRGWLTLVCASALLILLEVKSTREEQWLSERFPGYAEYQRRVRKLIPFVH